MAARFGSVFMLSRIRPRWNYRCDFEVIERQSPVQGPNQAAVSQGVVELWFFQDRTWTGYFRRVVAARISELDAQHGSGRRHRQDASCGRAPKTGLDSEREDGFSSHRPDAFRSPRRRYSATPRKRRQWSVPCIRRLSPSPRRRRQHCGLELTTQCHHQDEVAH